MRASSGLACAQVLMKVEPADDDWKAYAQSHGISLSKQAAMG